METNHLVAPLAAAAVSCPDAVVNLASVIGPRPPADLSVPPLTGPAAHQVASMSVRWAIKVIASCEDHATQRALLANERRSTVLSAACDNTHLAPDLALDLLRWAWADGRVEQAWQAANHPGVRLSDIEQLGDGVLAGLTGEDLGRLWDVTGFTPDDIELALAHGDLTLAAAALVAVQRNQDPELRTHVAATVAARYDVARVLTRALRYELSPPWDVDVVEPLAGHLVAALRHRSQARFTDAATEVLWRHAIGQDRTDRWRFRHLPVSPSALRLSATSDDPDVIAEVTGRLCRLDEDLVPAGLAIELAGRLDPTNVRSHAAAAGVLQFPLPDELVANALRCGGDVTTAVWLRGGFDHNPPSAGVVRMLVAEPGWSASLATRSERDGGPSGTGRNLTARWLTQREMVHHDPELVEAFHQAVAVLPGALCADVAPSSIHQAAVTVLTRALNERTAPAQSWELAAQLGVDWEGSVQDLLAVIDATE